jgi:hypothetical protein
MGGKGGLYSSKFNSYPKWIKVEIRSVSNYTNEPTLFEEGDSDSGSDSEDEQPVQPKTQAEVERQQKRRFVRKLNNKISQEEGFEEEPHSPSSEQDETKASVLEKIHNEDSNETDLDVGSDIDEDEDSTGSLLHFLNVTPNTQRQIKQLRNLNRKTPETPLTIKKDLERITQIFVTAKSK